MQPGPGIRMRHTGKRPALAIGEDGPPGHGGPDEGGGMLPADCPSAVDMGGTFLQILLAAHRTALAKSGPRHAAHEI